MLCHALNLQQKVIIHKLQYQYAASLNVDSSLSIKEIINTQQTIKWILTEFFNIFGKSNP